MVSEPERRPEPEPPVSIPSVRRDDHELEEELVPVRPVPSVPDVEETFPEPAPAAQELGADAEQELEEGTPPEEGEEERAGHGLFAHVRPLILDGEDLDLPPALRKKKPDPS